MISADIHTHTDYFHGRNTVEQMYAVAQKKGLTYYGFSEHSPLPRNFSTLLYREGDLNEAFRDYVRDVLALKEHTEKARSKKKLFFKNKHYPKILLGMELDYIPKDFDHMDTLINAHPFDYIIGSIHFVGSENIGLWDCDRASSQEKSLMFTKYYEAIAELAKWGKADIVAHPDFVKIHCIQDFMDWLSLESSLECIEKSMTEVKKSGMVLEVSTGGLIKMCEQIHPAPAIMQIVADLKIPISFGSDTHAISTVAYEFEALANFARSYGYKEHVIFEKRKPIILPF